MENTYTALIDQIGRTIIGTVTEESEYTLTIKNPVIVHVQPQATGQLSVNTFPLFFPEFIDKDHRDKNHWTFNKSNVTLSNVTLSPEVIKSYEAFNSPPAPVVTNPKVVSINDL